MTTLIRDDPVDFDRVLTVAGRPLWVVSGQLTVFIILFLGFGVRIGTPLKLVALLAVLGLLGVIGFGPIGQVRRIVASLPVVTFMCWYLASYSWTFNPTSWMWTIEYHIPLIVSGVVIVSTLPLISLVVALRTTCHLAIGYTAAYTVAFPGIAIGQPNGAGGVHGGFLHKNGMGPFLVFAMLVIVAWEHRARWRNVSMFVALLLILFSQSTTTYAICVALPPVGMAIRNLTIADPRRKAVRLFVAVVVAAASVALVSTAAPALLASQGKDFTFSRRTEVWAPAWRAILSRPLQGYGIGGVWENQRAEPALSIVRELGAVYTAHNGYIEVLLQLGAVGLVLLTVVLMRCAAIGFALLDRDLQLGRLLIMFVLLVVILSFSESATLNIWLIVLVMLTTLGTRALLHPEELPCGS